MIINFFALDDGDKKKIENEELTVEAVQMVTAMIKEAGPTLSSKEIEIIAGKWKYFSIKWLLLCIQSRIFDSHSGDLDPISTGDSTNPNLFHNI